MVLDVQRHPFGFLGTLYRITLENDLYLAMVLASYVSTGVA
ncbi:MAG: hypothetical protein ACFB0C_21615 [Leptolyngbyaceae cyanobacterium]